MGLVEDATTLRKKLAVELESLRANQPTTKAELKAWYEKARNGAHKVATQLADEVPKIVWHYLSDADIRSKPDEHEYADIQDREIRLVIQYLKRGEMPSDHDVKRYTNYG